MKQNTDGLFIPQDVLAMSEEAYRSAPGVNKSTLWEIRKSPAHYRYAISHPTEDTPALRFGRAFHMALLQPDLFKETYVLAPDFDRRFKAGREAYAEFMIKSANKELISETDYGTIESMIISIMENPDTEGSFKHTFNEVPLFWDDESTGLRCKARLDAVEGLEKGHYVIRDLKTCSDASTNAFMKDAIKYGYDVQAAHYIRGLKAITKADKVDWEFIAIEKKPPYAVNVVRCGADFLDRGTWQLIDLMDRLKTCMDTDTWPGYGTNELVLPEWAAMPDDE